MTETEEKQLLDWSAEIAGAEQSPWQPALVSAAFSSHRVFPQLTMQAWIDLDAARSPFLSGEWPEDADGIQRALTDAARALRIADCELQDSEVAARLTLDVRQAVADAFSTVLRMVPPMRGGTDRGECGFGNFAPVLACLISQVGMSEAAALALPVMRAFILIATHRFNEGWTPAGENYRQREASVRGHVAVRDDGHHHEHDEKDGEKHEVK